MKNTFFLALTGLLSLSCSRVDLSSQLSSGNDPFGNLAGSANQKTTNENIPTSSSSSNRNDTLPVGTWVETAFPDATFFKSYPIFGKKPTQTLPVASAAKIISHRGAYSKVELNTGAVGYIPSSMLIEQAQQQQETYSAPEPRELTSEPAPPTENEILQKIRERQQQAEALLSQAFLVVVAS